MKVLDFESGQKKTNYITTIIYDTIQFVMILISTFIYYQIGT